jgi:hypothetical protein
MLDIQIKQKMAPSVLSFLKREWEKADKKYREKEINWKKHIDIVTAYEDKKIIGVLELNYIAGVMHIEKSLSHLVIIKKVSEQYL